MQIWRVCTPCNGKLCTVCERTHSRVQSNEPLYYPALVASGSPKQCLRTGKNTGSGWSCRTLASSMQMTYLTVSRISAEHLYFSKSEYTSQSSPFSGGVAPWSGPDTLSPLCQLPSVCNDKQAVGVGVQVWREPDHLGILAQGELCCRFKLRDLLFMGLPGSVLWPGPGTSAAVLPYQVSLFLPPSTGALLAPWGHNHDTYHCIIHRRPLHIAHRWGILI